jgi:hypothetical protein
MNLNSVTPSSLTMIDDDQIERGNPWLWVFWYRSLLL